jgi:hypothetical protein
MRGVQSVFHNRAATVCWRSARVRISALSGMSALRRSATCLAESCYLGRAALPLGFRFFLDKLRKHRIEIAPIIHLNDGYFGGLP